MKSNLIIGFFLILVSCSSQPSKKTIHKKLVSGDFEAYHYLPTVSLDSLRLDSLTGLFYYNDELFTGEGQVLLKNQGVVLQKTQVFKGKNHGYNRFYSVHQDTLLEVLYAMGKPLRYNSNKWDLVQQDSVAFLDSLLTGIYDYKQLIEDSLQVIIESRFEEGELRCVTYFDEKDSVLMEYDLPISLFVDDTIVPLKD